MLFPFSSVWNEKQLAGTNCISCNSKVGRRCCVTPTLHTEKVKAVYYWQPVVTAAGYL